MKGHPEIEWGVFAPVCEHFNFCAKLFGCCVGSGDHAHVTAHANEVAGLRCCLLPLLLLWQ